MDDSFDTADATQDTSQPNRRSYATRPVTIRQLKRAEIKEDFLRSESFRYSLNGDDFHTATFVGYIIDVVASSETTLKIHIEDGTGKMTSMYTIAEEEREDPPRAGEYARLFGVPRKFKDVVLFNAYFIRPVDDPHEVFFHLMEAIAVTFQYSRGQPLPRNYASQFARATDPQPLSLTAEPGLRISTRSTALNPPPSESRPSPVASPYQVDDEPRNDSKDSIEADALGSTREAETADVQDTSDDDDDGGLTEYYTDPPPDSPIERSPSPTPVGLFARNHSFEGHSDREEGPSSQLSQSTQRPNVWSSDEEDGRAPRGKSKLQRKEEEDVVLKSPTKGPDDELEALRSEMTSQILPYTPPRRLKPDPYTEWSPAKRKIMVVLQSKTPGAEVNKKALGEGMTKLEMRNALKELVREGEIETVDNINYWLTDKGPKYPRF